MLGGICGCLLLVFAWNLSPGANPPPIARAPAHNVSSGAASASDDATTLGITPGRTYSQPSDVLAPPLAVKWTAPLVSDADYPIVAGGRVFATVHHPAGSGSTLFAFDGSTGKPVWSPVDLGGQRSYAGATYDQGKLFAVNSDGAGWELDPGTGKIGWHRSLGTTLSDAPVASGGRLYISSEGPLAFTELDGSRLWAGPSGPFATLAVSGASVFSSGNLNAIALDPATGTTQWR
jgi:outer membrane protein assembly factor BamB